MAHDHVPSESPGDGGLSRYQCPDCTSTFSRRQNLQRHRRTRMYHSLVTHPPYVQRLLCRCRFDPARMPKLWRAVHTDVRTKLLRIVARSHINFLSDLLQRHIHQHHRGLVLAPPPPRACKACASSKMRCDRESPCARCRAKGLRCESQSSSSGKLPWTPHTITTSNTLQRELRVTVAYPLHPKHNSPVLMRIHPCP